MDKTFDINDFDSERLKSPATWNQCDAIGKKFAKTKDGMNWRLHKQIRACLYNEIKQGKLSFAQASDMIANKKTLPIQYKRKITAYLDANQEA
jgi:hypothetical protein|tara:strand:+ start:993 stop:1271 length:279 start_codon:yes stop_codon:yes gene_type:complete